MSWKEQRRVHLLWLRDSRFGGIAARLAEALKRSPSQLNQWLSGHRSIEQDSLSYINKTLKLPHLGLAEAVPQAALAAALNRLVATWQAEAPEVHTELEFANRIGGDLAPPDMSVPLVVQRLRSGPWDAELLVAAENITGGKISFDVGNTPTASEPALPDEQAPVELAHGLSFPPFRLPPKKTTEGLMHGKPPELFTYDMPDDSMEGSIPKGTPLIFAAGNDAAPGQGVLVRDHEGNIYVRRFVQRRPGQWSAQAANGNFEPLTPEVDHIEVIAILQWVGSGRV